MEVCDEVLLDDNRLLADLLREFLAPPPKLTVTEWSERHRVLSSKDSAEPGPYRADRTPYAREPMDCLGHDSLVEEVVLMWGAQTSKTTVGSNWLGYLVDINPGPIMIVQPTIDMAKRYSRQRLTPMIQESATLRRKVSGNRSRDDANTTQLKEFAGGFMAIAGANSAAGLRSMPVRDLFLDEVDAYPLDVDGEGDPVKLAEARQSTFARRKRLITSTPTTKGMSRVEQRYLASDRCRYHVPCPHCGELQALEWGTDKPYGIKWSKDEAGAPIAASVRYVCRHCAAEILEHHKPVMLAGGCWLPDVPGAAGGKVRGFHLSSLYSPLGWVSWAALVDEWHRATTAAKVGDGSLLRVFINTRLGETFEMRGEQADEHQLRARAEPYQLRTCPRGVLMLTAGVDVQDRRWEISVWGWGRGEESWLIDHMILDGNPADERDWDRLDTYLKTRFTHEGGQTLPIEAIGVDTGGHFTHQAYNFCRTRSARRIFALQGGTRQGLPIKGRSSLQDVNYRGAVIKGGVRLWTVGTDTAKDLLFGRLEIQHDGPGRVHFTRDLPPEWFAQLTAEARVLQRTAQGEVWRWVKRQTRNEALDCAVYATFAAHAMDLPRYTDAMWSRIEERVNPVQGDLLSGAAITPENPAESGDNPEPTPPNPRNPAPIRRTGSNFANRWGR